MTIRDINSSSPEGSMGPVNLTTDEFPVSSDKSPPPERGGTRALPGALQALALRRQAVSTDPMTPVAHLAEGLPDSARTSMGEVGASSAVGAMPVNATDSTSHLFPPERPLKLDDLAIVFGNLSHLIRKIAVLHSCSSRELYVALYDIDISTMPRWRAAVSVLQASRYVKEAVHSQCHLIDLIFADDASRIKGMGAAFQGRGEYRDYQLQVIESAIRDVHQLVEAKEILLGAMRCDDTLLHTIFGHALRNEGGVGKVVNPDGELAKLALYPEHVIDLYKDIQVARHFPGTGMSLRIWSDMMREDRFAFAKAHCKIVFD